MASANELAEAARSVGEALLRALEGGRAERAEQLAEARHRIRLQLHRHPDSSARAGLLHEDAALDARIRAAALRARGELEEQLSRVREQRRLQRAASGGEREQPRFVSHRA